MIKRSDIGPVSHELIVALNDAGSLRINTDNMSRAALRVADALMKIHASAQNSNREVYQNAAYDAVLNCEHIQSFNCTREEFAAIFSRVFKDA